MEIAKHGGYVTRLKADTLDADRGTKAMTPEQATASLKGKSLDDLLYGIGRQYPVHVSTHSPCPCCGQLSRGGEFCRLCLQAELHRRGVSSLLTIHLMSARADVQAASARIEQAEEAIRRAVDSRG
jgi:hypothetical protein